MNNKLLNLSLQSLPNSIITEILCDSKLDGVVLDTEHGYFNNETLIQCIQVATLMNKKAIVRFTDLNKTLIRMCLDNGCSGVIFSTVETPEQAKLLIEYCQYPINNGIRGSSLCRENSWGRKEMSTRKPIIIAQIETKKGVDNLNELYKLNFDYFLIGPYDLSASLGCTAEWNNPLYKAYINQINLNIQSDRLGMFLPSIKDINNYLNNKQVSPSLLVWGLDVDFIKNCIENYIKI
jgi:2-dehydro-3-deoxyglucarate aldolase